jgi:hypothetical protein
LSSTNVSFERGCLSPRAEPELICDVLNRIDVSDDETPSAEVDDDVTAAVLEVGIDELFADETTGAEESCAKELLETELLDWLRKEDK